MSNTSIPLSGTPLTVFVVAKPDGSLDSDYLYLYGYLYSDNAQYNVSIDTVDQVSFYQRPGVVASTNTLGTDTALLSQVFGQDSPYYELFIDGTQETVSPALTTNIADVTTSAFHVGTSGDGSYPHPYIGDICEIVVIEEAIEEDRQKIEGYLAWKWGTEGSLPLDHPYKNAPPTEGVESVPVLAFIGQPYGMLDALLGHVSQPYGQTIYGYVSQAYGDASQLVGENYQYYGVATELVKATIQPYGRSPELVGVVGQPYEIQASLISALYQSYVIASDPVVNSLRQPYELLSSDMLLTANKQPYGLYDAIESIDLDGSVTWEGVDGLVPLNSISASISYGVTQYSGTINVAIEDYTTWTKMRILDPIIFTYGGTSYHGLITRLTETDSGNANYTYGILARSKAVLLDFPHASQIVDDSLLPDNASVLVQNIAALEGEVVEWNLDTDPYLTDNELSLASNSPIEAIRNISSAYGGYIKSSPDGSISVEKNFLYDTDKYLESDVVISYGIESSTSVTQYQSYTDDREGYNIFSVESSETSTGYTLESEDIGSSRKLIKAYKIPWDSAPVSLITSENTNISISSPRVVTELVTDEEVEIISGAGSLAKPSYESVTPDYKDSNDLGVMSSTEDGTLSTEIEGNTLADVSYYTKYWAWDVIDTDIESVQLILVTE